MTTLLRNGIVLPMTGGPGPDGARRSALAALDPSGLPGYYLLPAARADFLRRLDRRPEAVTAYASGFGLGATYSTTYHEPFHVARVFATLDQVSAGRAAWNVVTSATDLEAQNAGLEVMHEEFVTMARMKGLGKQALGLCTNAFPAMLLQQAYADVQCPRTRRRPVVDRPD